MNLSNPIVSGLASGLAVLILVYFASRMEPAGADAEGWHHLKPGWLFKGLFFACLVIEILLLIGLGTLFSRQDWREQITPLVLMIVGFGAGVAWSGWVSYGRTIRWNGDQIEVRTIRGDVTNCSWSNIGSVHTNSLTGEYIIKLAGGSKLRVPTMMKGARELALFLKEKGF